MITIFRKHSYLENIPIAFHEIAPIGSAIGISNIRHSMDLLFTNQANTIGTHPESFQQNSNSNTSTICWLIGGKELLRARFRKLGRFSRTLRSIQSSPNKILFHDIFMMKS